MTAGEAREILGTAKAKNRTDYPLDYAVAMEMAITALGAIEQIMWERDMAISQLEEIGVSFGEKMDEVKEALEKQIEKFVDCPKGFQGVRNTRYYCPACKALTRQCEAFCHKCGQSVKYPKEVYDKENNRIALDWGEEE